METILFNEAMNALAVPDRGIPNYAKSKIAEHTRRLRGRNVQFRAMRLEQR